MFIDLKRLSAEKNDELSQELKVLNKSIKELKRSQQSLSDKHKNNEVRQNQFEQNLNLLQSETNMDVEEIVHKAVDTNLSCP